MTIEALVVDGENKIKAVPLSQFQYSERTGELIGEAVGSPSLIHQFVPAVYRCVHLRAQSASRVPFELKRAGRARLSVDQAWLEKRLPRLIYLTEASLCLHGAAYQLPIRNRVKVLDLKWLVAQSITAQVDPRSGLTGFERSLGEGRSQVFKPDELLYTWLPDPDVEVGPGRSPADVALAAAMGSLRSDEYVASFFERGGVNLTLLITDPTTKDDELKRLETWWKRVTRGVKKAWQTIAFRKNVDVKQFGYPVKDLAMPELEGQALRKIANAFGVPEYYLSSDVANFATAKSYDLTFNETTIKAQLALIEAAWNEQLMGLLGLELIFHPESLEVFQEAELSKAQGITELVGKPILTMDEGRALLEKEPLPPENVPPRLEGMLVADVESGVVTKNERRARLGLEEVPEDVSEVSRRQLLAQLAIVKAATDAKLTPVEGIQLALGESLESLLAPKQEASQAAQEQLQANNQQPLANNQPQGANQAQDGAAQNENGTPQPSEGSAPSVRSLPDEADVKALLREVRKLRVAMDGREAV